MQKELLRRVNRLHHVETQSGTADDDHKLSQIIQTFRENHLKLIQKIEECDKKR